MDHAADNHDRNKVGHIGDGLHRAAEFGGAYFIEEQRKDNRSRKRKQRAVKTDQKGVFDHADKVVAVYKLGKML